MTAYEIRRAFIEYFKKNGHEHVPSSSLIPQNDDTLLFANAGMNQFKNIFLGLETRPYKRAVTSQKCVRAGGKHNDLENVGFTARHHTFFEMLGNFSFGDYFKKEAIHFGWEFLTQVLKIPKDRLYVTVFREDDEAAEIWNKQENISLDRISRFDEKDNFWMMGDTGPCGPCSEIFFDHGPKAGCGKPSCKVGCSCDRYVEIWNLVFMQFNQNADGSKVKLPKPSVDTGAGLERIAAVMQGKVNNYETDLFAPLIETGMTIADVDSKYSADEKLVACRVLADHARATAFLIADGVLPSNEGRGYVLRRIMRRAIRYGRKLSQRVDGPLSIVVNEVIKTMGQTYDELNRRRDHIMNTVAMEETRFLQTLDNGSSILNSEIQSLRKSGNKTIGAELLFKLYDTFGFPVDLTRLIAQENGFEVDEPGFEALMEKSKAHAKTTWKAKGVTADAGHLIELGQKGGTTKFTGYEGLESSGKILLLSNGKEVVKELSAGQNGMVLLDVTPFYAESGGQVGDTGVLKSSSVMADVLDTTKSADAHIHHVQVTKGTLKLGETVTADVSHSPRRSTMRNHSATHLLHSALRTVLGKHVTQAGSLVAPDRLRFDFTHTGPMTESELERVERLVNEEISKANKVDAQKMDYKKAISSGAMALFGEKYGDEVRVIRMGDFSTELCGGTHVHNTSDIRLIKIVSESGVSAGVRRMEAITGDLAVQYLMSLSKEALIARKKLSLETPWTKVTGVDEKASYISLNSAIEENLDEKKRLEREVKKLKSGEVNVDAMVASAKVVGGAKFICEAIDMEDRDVLSEIADKLKNKIGSGIVVLIGKGSDSHPIIVSVTKDLVGKYNAGKILQVVATEMGGRGGGRPDFAQGAGKDLTKIPQARAKAEALL